MFQLLEKSLRNRISYLLPRASELQERIAPVLVLPTLLLALFSHYKQVNLRSHRKVYITTE